MLQSVKPSVVQTLF